MKETKFNPFDKVLVRDVDTAKWKCDLFSYIDQKNDEFPFITTAGCRWGQCIPYEGNEELVGTTNKPEEKKWKPEEGEYYFTIRLNLDTMVDYNVKRFAWGADEIDDFAENNGWVFQTKEEAQEMCDRLNNAIKNVLKK